MSLACCMVSNETEYLIGFNDGMIQRWCIEPRRHVKTWRQHRKKPHVMKFTHDGKYVYSANSTEEIRFSLTDNPCVLQPRKLSQSRTCVCWRDSDQSMFYGTKRGGIVQCPLGHTYFEESWFYGHRLPVTALCLTPDEKYLYSASEDTTIRKWSLSPRYCVSIMTGHSQRVTHLCLAHQFLLSYGFDKSVRQWCIHSNRLLRVIPHVVIHSKILVNTKGTCLYHYWRDTVFQLDLLTGVTSQVLQWKGLSDITLGPDDTYLLLCQIHGTVTRFDLRK